MISVAIYLLEPREEDRLSYNDWTKKIETLLLDNARIQKGKNEKRPRPEITYRWHVTPLVRVCVQQEQDTPYYCDGWKLELFDAPLSHHSTIINFYSRLFKENSMGIAEWQKCSL